MPTGGEVTHIETPARPSVVRRMSVLVSSLRWEHEGMASAETPPDVRDGLAGHGLDVPRHARGDEREAAVDVWLLANDQSGRAPHLGSLRQWVRQPETVVGVVPGLSGGIVAAGLVLPGRAADGEGDLIPGLAHLTGVCVHPGVQGKGVGSSLLRFLLEDRRRAQCLRATLWTHADNAAALRFFARHGFTRSGRTANDQDDQPMVHLLTDLVAR